MVNNMKDKLFVGIDPSLSHTGVFFIYDDKYDGIQIDTKPNDFSCGLSRCIFISETIINLINEKINSGLKLAMISCEDYFTGRQHGTVIQLAELGTMIRYKILKNDFPLCVVAPTKLKKFVTTKGNSPKNMMLKAVYKKWGYDVTTDNIADASGLANFAKVVYTLHNKPDTIKLLQYEKDVFKEYMTENCLIKL